MTSRHSTEKLWLAEVPRDCGGSVFPDAWQATAFVLAVKLADAGVFTWKEWVAGLAEEIAKGAKQDREEVDYYRRWLANLEKLLLRKNLVEAATISRRKLDWIRAYETTPHGRPVRLSA